MYEPTSNFEPRVGCKNSPGTTVLTMENLTICQDACKLVNIYIIS